MCLGFDSQNVWRLEHRFFQNKLPRRVFDAAGGGARRPELTLSFPYIHQTEWLSVDAADSCQVTVIIKTCQSTSLEPAG